MGIAGSCLLYPQETKQVNKLYPPHTRGTEDNLTPYQIQRLTNYLSRNPKHLPNVGKYRYNKFIVNRVLENRIHKDLYKGRIGYVKVGMLSLNKILESCHNKLALFEEQVINIVLFLLEEPNIDLRLLTLTTFNIYVRYQDDLADKNKLSVFVKELIALSRFKSDNIQKDYTCKLEALRSIMSLILAMDENTLNSNLLDIYPVIFENLNENAVLIPQGSSSNVDGSSAEPHDTPKSVAFDCLTNIAGVISANSFDTFLNPLLHHLDDIRWSPIEFSIQCMRALCVSMNKSISIPLYLYLLRHAKVLHDSIKSNEFLQPQSAASSSNILVSSSNLNTANTANTNTISNTANTSSTMLNQQNTGGRVVQSMRLPNPIRQDSMTSIEMTRLRSQTEVDSDTAKQCLKNMIPVIVNTIRITRNALTPWIIETIDIFLSIYSYYVLENVLEIANQNMKKSLEDLIIEFENKLKGSHETIEVIDKIMNYNIMSLNLPNERYLLHLIELICSNTKETLPLNDNLLRSIMERIKSDDVVIQLSALKIFNSLLSPEMTSLTLQTSTTVRRQQIDDDNRQIQSQHSENDLDQSYESTQQQQSQIQQSQPLQPQIQKPKVIQRKLTDFQKQAIFSLLYRGILSCPVTCPELLLEYCKTINILLSMDWSTYSSTMFHIALRLQWEAIHDSPIDTSNLSLDDITLRDRPDDYINSMTLETVIPKPQTKQLLLHLVVSSILYSYQLPLENNELKQYIVSVVEYRKCLDGWNHKQIMLDYNTGLLYLLPEELLLANVDEVILEVKEEEEEKEGENNKDKKSPCFIKKILLDYIHDSPQLPLLLEKDMIDYESKLRQVFVLPDYPIAFSIPGQFYPESIVSETIHQSIADNTHKDDDDVDGDNDAVDDDGNSISSSINSNESNNEGSANENGVNEYETLLRKTTLKLQQKKIRMQRLEPIFKLKRCNMDFKNDFDDTFKFSITPPSLNYQHL